MNFQSPETEQVQEEADIDPSNSAFAVARIATAQICQSVGFTATYRSALDTLTDVAARYLGALAESAVASATSSGRTQSNLNDVVRALEDLGSVHGFRGAWNVGQTLLASSTLVDLSEFVKFTDEIPFAKPIPRRRFLPLKSVPPETKSLGFSHVPRWLPQFPEFCRRGINGKGAEEEVSSSGIGIGSCGEFEKDCLVGDEKMRMGLPEKRDTVRFKMCLGVGRLKGKRAVWGEGSGGGVDLRSGVCRGGKRVSCQNKIHKEKGEEDEECGSQKMKRQN